MTRSTLRGAVLLVASAALAAGALSGCGAGQVTQTENQQVAVDGAHARSGDGLIQLLDVAFTYPGPKGYPQGGRAPLHLRIVNSGTGPVRLIGVESPAGAVVLSGTGVAPSPAPSSPSATAGASPSAGTSASGGPSATNGRSQAPGPGASGSVPPSTTATAAPAAPGPSPAGITTIKLEIAADGFLALDPALPRFLQVINLREELVPGRSIEMTFRFDSGAVITLAVPVAVPLSPLPRSPIELPEDEGH